MQDQTITSEQRLAAAKERLKKSLTRLDGLIEEQNSKINNERNLRTQVIKDLDAHIENLEAILQD